MNYRQYVKTLFIILPLLFSSSQVLSQVDFGLTYGVVLNSAQIKGIGDPFLPEVAEFTGSTAGLDLHLQIDEHFSFVSGLFWEERGMDAKYGLDVDFLGLEVPLGLKIKTRIDYLEMPLGIKVKFATNRKVNPYFMGGAKLGYAIDGDVTIIGQVVIDFKLSQIPINLASDNARRFDLSPFMGTGLDIPYKNSVFTFGLQYEYSVFNFLKETSLAVEFRHYGFTGGLSYKYLFGRKKEKEIVPDRV